MQTSGFQSFQTRQMHQCKTILSEEQLNTGFNNLETKQCQADRQMTDNNNQTQVTTFFHPLRWYTLERPFFVCNSPFLRLCFFQEGRVKTPLNVYRTF